MRKRDCCETILTCAAVPFYTFVSITQTLKAPLPPLTRSPSPVPHGGGWNYGILASPVATGEVASLRADRGAPRKPPVSRKQILELLGEALLLGIDRIPAERGKLLEEFLLLR